MGVGGQHHAPAALLPGKTRYPLYRRLSRPQGWSGQVWKISPPPEFDPRTVKPVASHYTDCATAATAAAAAATTTTTTTTTTNNNFKVVHPLVFS